LTSITSKICNKFVALFFAAVPRTRVLFLILALLLTMITAFPLFTLAQTNAQTDSAAGVQNSLPPIENVESIRLPADFDRVEFYLITVDVGNALWNNFGHTALRVVDDETDTDLIFNWGLFDTSVGYVTFASNFLRGIMAYELGVSPPSWELRTYEREQRTVWQDRINLTRAQKETLYKRLAWNLREENISYDYHYFFDNCTTRVRDYLNEALQGDISTQHQSLVRATWRDEVMAHYASLPPIALSLDVLMNSTIDRRMTEWEHMFLPLELRNKLLDHPSGFQRNGQRLNLLDDSMTLMQYSPPPAYMSVYYYIALVLLVPLLYLVFNLRRISLSSFTNSPGYTLKVPGVNFRLLGLLGLVIALISGIFGIMMVFGWSFSGHEVMYHNINLLLFWPTDILAVAMAMSWLIFGQAIRISSGRYSLISFYLLIHVLAALAYVIAGISGLVDQRMNSIIIFVVPVLLLFTLLVWTAGLRPIRNMSFR
jgi:hypothetical protein